MTEYDFSPAAWQRHLKGQERVGRWVNTGGEQMFSPLPSEPRNRLPDNEDDQFIPSNHFDRRPRNPSKQRPRASGDDTYGLMDRGRGDSRPKSKRHHSVPPPQRPAIHLATHQSWYEPSTRIGYYNPGHRVLTIEPHAVVYDESTKVGYYNNGHQLLPIPPYTAVHDPVTGNGFYNNGHKFITIPPGSSVREDSTGIEYHNLGYRLKKINTKVTVNPFTWHRIFN